MIGWLAGYLHHGATVGFGIAVFFLAELAFPRSSAGWLGRLQGLLFWVIAIAGATTAALVMRWIVSAAGVNPLLTVSLPWPVSLILAGLIADLFYYWFHRAQHTVPALWRLHAVHHAIRDLSAVNSYHHWSEELVRIPFIALPMALLVHLDYADVPLAVSAISLQGYLLHANTKLNLGPLNRFIADNRTHRVHHSAEEPHFGKNYGSFCTIWDQLFGTAYFPAPGEWPAVGLGDRAETASIAGYLLALPPPTRLGAPLGASDRR